MLALEVAAVTIILSLLHSLFIVTCCCYLPAYPKLFSIGWVETHQRPPLYPDCPTGLSEDPINGIEDQAPTPHITPLSCNDTAALLSSAEGETSCSTSDVNFVE